ncbi:vitamin B12-dependent ribonucleotide reductase [Lichenicola sp.]|uniref:TSCPD domain-containing protein n=1 Tax=Lichenicola sp. TaxID=2804529 RepID=UPI003B00E76F
MNTDPSNAGTGTRSAGSRGLWNGVRMRVADAAADPDAAPRRVSLPTDWEAPAAEALAALVSGNGATSLAEAAGRWIDRLANLPGAGRDLPRKLVRLLLLRQAAPGPAIWAADHAAAPSFVINLAAFVKPGSGFETESYTDALHTLAHALRLAEPELFAPSLTPQLLLTNLDACLAGLGLDYDAEPGRDVARCLAAAAAGVMRGDEDGDQLSLVRPPSCCAVPGLSSLAALVREAAPPGRRIETGFSAPGPVDALLGVEGCGLAPIFSPLRPDGRLSESTLARLSGRGLTPEAALALSLSGDGVLPRPGRDAWLAMHRALAGLVDRMPPLPERQPTLLPAGTTRRDLPARRRGFTQKAAIAGHRLFLQTGEFDDGSLGELVITPPRETPAMRGLMDAFTRSVSLGLQHGVPLEAYVEAFAYSRFGPAGQVDGDTGIAHATSLLDYAFRMLSEAYLGRPLPDAPHVDADPSLDDRPLLPLDLPETGARPRSPTTGRTSRTMLRVVGGGA